MIGSLIGLGVQLAGAVAGGLMASKAAKRRLKSLQKQKEDNQAWFDRRYNEDATQRADAQRLLSMTRDTIRERNRSTAGRQAVMGGTDAAVAAEKERNNKLYGDTLSRINAQGEARKDKIEGIYLNRADRIDKSMQQTEQDRANAITSAIKGVGAAGAAAGKAIDGGLEKWGTRSGDSDGGDEDVEEEDDDKRDH